MTTQFYTGFLDATGVAQTVTDRLGEEDFADAEVAPVASHDSRRAIESEPFPSELETALETAWEDLCSLGEMDDTPSNGTSDSTTAVDQMMDTLSGTRS